MVRLFLWLVRTKNIVVIVIPADVFKSFFDGISCFTHLLLSLISFLSFLLDGISPFLSARLQRRNAPSTRSTWGCISYLGWRCYCWSSGCTRCCYCSQRMTNSFRSNHDCSPTNHSRSRNKRIARPRTKLRLNYAPIPRQDRQTEPG